MAKKSEKDSAVEQRRPPRAPSPQRLAQLRNANERDRDDGPGLPPASRRVHRDRLGRLTPKSPSPIRDALLRELGRRDITRYQLWKLGRAHCPTLPESAVYEFLRGQRAISVTYCEALLNALDLTVLPLRKPA